MSVFSILKKIAIWPFVRKASIDVFGKEDSWGVLTDSLGPKAIVLSAGAGKSISFENELAQRYGCKIILLDPSPTGRATMEGVVQKNPNIEFKPLGLAATSGQMVFGVPQNKVEGSFRKPKNLEVGEVLKLDCISLSDVMNQINAKKIDLLKIDIEGFEYEVIESIIDSGVKIDQICMEIHTNRSIPTDHGVFAAYWLICRLFMNGYRIIYNKAMDFTFLRKRHPKRES